MMLSTERLLLREFVSVDWPAVLAYQSDPRYLRYYDWTGRTEQDVRAFVQGFVDQQHEQPRTCFQLAIVERSEGQLIGNCGIRLKADDVRLADMGYELSPLYWGRGYATEAARAMLAWGWDALELHRVWAWCLAENTASAHVLEKLGFQCEGRLREHEWAKGQWWDTLLYGLLRSEWRELCSH